MHPFIRRRMYRKKYIWANHHNFNEMITNDIAKWSSNYLTLLYIDSGKHGILSNILRKYSTKIGKPKMPLISFRIFSYARHE